MTSGGNQPSTDEPPAPLFVSFPELARDIAISSGRRSKRLTISAGAIVISLAVHALAASVFVVLLHSSGEGGMPKVRPLPQVIEIAGLLDDVDSRLLPLPTAHSGAQQPLPEPMSLPPLPAILPPPAPLPTRNSAPTVDQLGTLTLSWEADPGRPRITPVLPLGPAQLDSNVSENPGTMPAPAIDTGAALQSRGADPSTILSPGTGTGSSGSNSPGTPASGSGHDASGGPPIPHAANRSPAYPLESRQRGEQGNVRVRLTISPSGQVTAVEVMNSSGHAALDTAAVGAVKTWRFNATSGEDRIAEQELRFFLH